MQSLVPIEQVERNTELANDYMSLDSEGKPVFTMAQLVAKFGISPVRIYELLRKKGVVIRSTKKPTSRKAKKG